MKHYRPASTKSATTTTFSLPPSSQKLNQSIEEAVMKQKQCEERNEYIEAQFYKRKVKELKLKVEEKGYTFLQKKHDQQLASLRQAHEAEINVFNIKWDKAFADYQEEVKKSQKNISQKQQREKKIISENINKFRKTPQILELQKMEKQLVKQQNYFEAERVQKMLAKTYKEAREKIDKNSHARNKDRGALLKKKHEQELQVFKQRVHMEIEENKRQRMNMCQQLILKYNTTMKDMQENQKQQFIKYSKHVNVWKNGNSYCRNQ